MDKKSDNCNKGGGEKNEVSSSCEEFKICKPDSGLSSAVGSSNPFLSSSRSSSCGSSSSSSVTLRSSVLGSSLVTPSSTNSAPDSQGKTFVLNPPRLSNPFTKPSDDDKDESGSKEKPEQTSPSTKENSGDESATCSSVSNATNSSSSKVSFVPLGWNSASSGVSTSNSVSSSHVSSAPTFASFVFGQNLRDKVEDPKSSDCQTEVSSSTDSNHQQHSAEEPKANGTTSEMLFSSAVKQESNDSKPSESTKSLSEAAREYEEARSVKRKFEPVQLITGEENERNVLQMNCKLFAYDKASLGWQERGRGLLRLNDSPSHNTSRLIIRAHGSLRLLINTKVWSEMVVQRASPKSLRITAMDNSETVKVFLISASQTEMDDLQLYLDSRVRKSEESDSTNHSKKLKPHTDHVNNSS